MGGVYTISSSDYLISFTPLTGLSPVTTLTNFTLTDHGYKLGYLVTNWVTSLQTGLPRYKLGYLVTNWVTPPPSTLLPAK